MHASCSSAWSSHVDPMLVSSGGSTDMICNGFCKIVEPAVREPGILPLI